MISTCQALVGELIAAASDVAAGKEAQAKETSGRDGDLVAIISEWIKGKGGAAPGL